MSAETHKDERLREKAERIVSEREVVTLSNRDWSAFYASLDKPLAPNAALKQAFKRYMRARG